jgi:hypothetical protein
MLHQFKMKNEGTFLYITWALSSFVLEVREGRGRAEIPNSEITIGAICQNHDMMFQSFHSTDLLAPVISAGNELVARLGLRGSAWVAEEKGEHRDSHHAGLIGFRKLPASSKFKVEH